MFEGVIRPSLHTRQRHLQQQNLLNPFVERFDFAVLGEAVGAVARAGAVEIEEMPASSAALELFEPAFVIGGSKPVTRCTASEMRTRYDSRWPGIVAAGEVEITSVFTFIPTRAASSLRIV